jgi:hypothetical protein
VKRCLYVLLGACWALLPAVVEADTNLQPPLDQVLALPPAGYTALNLQGYPHGFVGLADFASLFGPDAVADASQNLQQNGFVGGYSLQWADGSVTHALIEYVIAFSGGKGAINWLAYAKAADLKDPTYKHADTMPGLGQYWYGEHNVFSDGFFLDAFIFVKGNDVFVVGFDSKRDDALGLATNQATAQYVRAPSYTIPPDQWPENASNSSNSFPVGAAVVVALIIGALGAAFGGAYVIVTRRRLQAAAAPAPPPTALQVSPDGRFWFDGTRWVDGWQDPPPFAPRSSDGAMWWDGTHWRPIPETAQTH